jgi:plasmid stabilization system protein ParE
MSKRPEASVLRLLDEGIALQGIVADTGWSGDEIKALAQQHGFGFNVASMRFQRVALPKQVAGVPRPPAAADPLELIKEGKRSSNRRVIRAAVKAEAALGELLDVLQDTRASEAKAARVRELEEQLRLARAELRTGARPAVSTSTIRKWALGQGMEVGRTGSLPEHIVDRYHAAHQGSTS